MGYVETGTTVNIDVYLTQTGRQLLLKGDKTRAKVAFFALGDSDTNYFVQELLQEGSVPDVTGNGGDCIPSISMNIDIKNKINL